MIEMYSYNIIQTITEKQKKNVIKILLMCAELKNQDIK